MPKRITGFAADPEADAQRQAEREKLFKKWHAAIARGRRAYAEADKAIDAILATDKPGTTVRITDRGKEIDLVLVDQFAHKNKVWAGSSCARFKIEERAVKPQDTSDDDA